LEFSLTPPSAPLSHWERGWGCLKSEDGIC
jgi:hypothetical protein